MLASRRNQALLATLVVLAVSATLQLTLASPGHPHPLSDIPNVFRLRHVGPDALPYLDRRVEYPVVIGFALWGASLFGDTAFSVWVATAVLSAALALVATTLLVDREPRRIWRWVLGPPLLIYAFQNWDLLAIVPMLVGLAAFQRRKDGWAGAALGVGAAAKLFPAAVVPPLLALRLASGDRAGARRLALGAVGAFAVLNLPVLVASPSGWWWPFRFQSHRSATWGSGWSYFFRLPGLHDLATSHPAQLANACSAVFLVATIGWLTWRATRVPLAPSAVAAAAVALFMLSNKVYSPAYDLWLLPFFVLVPLTRRLFLAYCAVDFAIFATVYGYFHGLHSRQVVVELLPWLVLVRTVVLLIVVFRCTRGREPAADDGIPEPVVPAPARAAVPD